MEKDSNWDDAKRQKHARDTLINNWQHSAREDDTGHPCDATKKRNKKKEKASNLEMTSVIRKRSQMYSLRWDKKKPHNNLSYNYTKIAKSVYKG